MTKLASFCFLDVQDWILRAADDTLCDYRCRRQRSALHLGAEHQHRLLASSRPLACLYGRPLSEQNGANSSECSRAASLVVIGLSIGMGGQQALMAAQTVFKGPNIAIASSVLIFWQMFAGTLIIAVAQSIFQTQLVSELERLVPAVDPRLVLGTGVSEVAEVMGRDYPQYLDGILDAYNLALRRVFLMALILTCLSVFPVLGVEWVSVKKGPKQTDAEKSKDVQDGGLEMQERTKTV
jgi:hypothetical protein